MKFRYVFPILVITFGLIALIPVQADDRQDQTEDTEHNHAATKEHNEEGEKEEFSAREFIFDHIGDSHQWHVFTMPNGHHVNLYLPVILYSKSSGFHIFSSKKLAHGHTYKNFMLLEQGEYAGEITELDTEGNIKEDLPLDVSITRNVASMMFVATLLLFLFIGLARSYRKTGVSAPKGIQGFLEPIVLFVRDDIALPNIGEEKYGRFMPYLLTVFFFILFNNLLGLVPVIPGGSNVTGNIAVTFTLAFFSMVMINVNGSKAYWKDIFNTPGVPWWLKFPIPLMPVVELIGVIAKPFALMIRLFANITAGHIVVLSLVALIFIFDSLAVAPLSIFMVLFMDILELLVAFIQAYVFTLLTALFIGLAVQEHH